MAASVTGRAINRDWEERDFVESMQVTCSQTSRRWRRAPFLRSLRSPLGCPASATKHSRTSPSSSASHPLLLPALPVRVLH